LSISPFRVFRETSAESPEAPIRAELFSVERLEQHAESLAAAQQIAPNPKRGRPLAKRLSDNSRILTEAYRAIGQANSAHLPATRSRTLAALVWQARSIAIAQGQRPPLGITLA